MVGILVSFRDGPFSGAMLVSGRVSNQESWLLPKTMTIDMIAIEYNPLKVIVSHHHYSLYHTYLMLLHDCVQFSQHYLPQNPQVMYKYSSSCWFQPIWTNISQIGSFPHVRLKITNIWNYYPVFLQQSWFNETCPFGGLNWTHLGLGPWNLHVYGEKNVRV